MKVTINGSMVDLDVGKKIVLLRMSKGFNRVSLAKQAGISTSCLEDIQDLQKILRYELSKQLHVR